MTQNLIESVRWYMEAPMSVIKPERGGDGTKTWKQKAWSDLEDMLLRKPSEFGIAAQHGVNFEKKIYEFANNETRAGSKEFNEICDSVKGMRYFHKEGKTFKINELECYIYAKYDAILLPKIIDLKTTAKYKKGKYLNSVQHKLYCFVSEAEEFEYIIGEWDEYPKLKAVHREVYRVQNKDLLKTEVEMMILDCFDNLMNLNLWEKYRDTYCLY